MEKGTPYNKQYPDKADLAKAAGDFTVTQTPPPPFITEALDIIDGKRQEEYGGPEDSFATIAAMWTAHLIAAGLLKPGYVIAPENVAGMMRLMKEARLAHHPSHRDSFVDVVGYLAIEARMRGID